MPGGRIPADNRPVQAKGVGKNSKRHDLARREVPPLHGSDLQQGDVQALENGQRVAPKQTQQPASGQPAPQQAQPQQQTTGGGGFAPPDPIDFIAGRGGGQLRPPVTTNGPSGTKFASWAPILRGLVAGPGSSGGLAAAFINQVRTIQREAINRPMQVIDLGNVDTGIEAMLDELNDDGN